MYIVSTAWAVVDKQYFLISCLHTGVFDPPDDWPFLGDITVRNVEMRYAKELEPVLQNINLRIKGGEKVGHQTAVNLTAVELSSPSCYPSRETCPGSLYFWNNSKGSK